MQTKNRGRFFENSSRIFLRAQKWRNSVLIFAQIRANSGLARKCAKISTNKVFFMGLIPSISSHTLLQILLLYNPRVRDFPYTLHITIFVDDFPFRRRLTWRHEINDVVISRFVESVIESDGDADDVCRICVSEKKEERSLILIRNLLKFWC